MGGRPRTRRTARTHLRQQVSGVVQWLVLALLASAVICASTVVWAASEARQINDRLVPIQLANKAVLQDLSDAESGLQAFQLSNAVERESARGRVDNKKYLRGYLLGVNYLPFDQRRLQVLAADDPALTRAVAEQREASDVWIRDFALAAATRNEFDPTELRRGKVLFDRIRVATLRVDREIAAVSESTEDNIRNILLLVVATVVLLPALVLTGALALARRFATDIVEPLEDISDVIGRLHDGDTSARASWQPHLSEEMGELMVALNRLAEENVRGRDVEESVMARLEEIDRVRSELVSTVSHELRTPLTSVQGYVEVLHQELSGSLQPRHERMLAAVRRNTARLTELVNNLLHLSRAEDLGLEAEPLDLRVVALEVADDLRLTAAARGITLRTLPAGQPVVVTGDRTQLTRACTNLVTNAIKFSESGDLIEIRVSGQGTSAVLDILDEGIGIPAEDQAHLGSRFFRGANASRAEIPGTGLGIRIVQTILERHGGGLAIESEEGRGTTVTLTLPLSQPSSQLTTPHRAVDGATSSVRPRLGTRSPAPRAPDAAPVPADPTREAPRAPDAAPVPADPTREG